MKSYLTACPSPRSVGGPLAPAPDLIRNGCTKTASVPVTLSSVAQPISVPAAVEAIWQHTPEAKAKFRAHMHVAATKREMSEPIFTNCSYLKETELLLAEARWLSVTAVTFWNRAPRNDASP